MTETIEAKIALKLWSSNPKTLFELAQAGLYKLTWPFGCLDFWDKLSFLSAGGHSYLSLAFTWYFPYSLPHPSTHKLKSILVYFWSKSWVKECIWTRIDRTLLYRGRGNSILTCFYQFFARPSPYVPVIVMYRHAQCLLKMEWTRTRIALVISSRDTVISKAEEIFGSPCEKGWKWTEKGVNWACREFSLLLLDSSSYAILSLIHICINRMTGKKSSFCTHKKVYLWKNKMYARALHLIFQTHLSFSK